MNTLSVELLTEFDLSFDESSNLERYYLLHWSGKYFRSLYERSPRFDHQSVSYQILFHNGDVSNILMADNVMVSFRYPGKPYPYGYAMVKAFYSADYKRIAS